MFIQRRKELPLKNIIILKLAEYFCTKILSIEQVTIELLYGVQTTLITVHTLHIQMFFLSFYDLFIPRISAFYGWLSICFIYAVSVD